MNDRNKERLVRLYERSMRGYPDFVAARESFDSLYVNNPFELEKILMQAHSKNEMPWNDKEREEKPRRASFYNDTYQFLNMSGPSKLAFWVFLKSIAGRGGDLAIHSYRVCGTDVYIRGTSDLTDAQTDPRAESPIFQVTFKLSKDEARFCCSLQELVEDNSAKGLVRFLDEALDKLQTVRQPFYTVALLAYKPVFEILEYAPDEMKEKFERFKQEATKHGLDRTVIPLEGDLPPEVRAEDALRRQARLANALRTKAQAEESRQKEMQRLAMEKIERREREPPLWVENVIHGNSTLRISMNGKKIDLPPRLPVYLNAHGTFQQWSECAELKHYLERKMVIQVEDPGIRKAELAEYARKDSEATYDFVEWRNKLHEGMKREEGSGESET